MHVQFYLTLLDTYVPDHDGARRGVRRGREHPVDPAQGRVLLPWIDSIYELDAAARPASDRAAVPAQPDLLRRLHRGAVLLRRLRLRLLPALARPAQRAGRRHQLGVPRRVDAHGLRLRRGRHRPRARSRTCSTTSSAQQVTRDARRGRRRARSQFAEDLLRRRRRRACRRADMRAVPASTSPTSGSPRLGHRRRATARRTRSRFMELQDVQELSNFFERRVSAYQVGVSGDGRLRRRLLTRWSGRGPAGRPSGGARRVAVGGRPHRRWVAGVGPDHERLLGVGQPASR